MSDKSFWEYGDFGTKLPFADNPWESGSRMAPFDQEFFIVMNLAVGGTNKYFHDNFSHEPSKPWDNDSKHGKAMADFWQARDEWLPTWNGNSAALKVDYVRVWKLEP